MILAALRCTLAVAGIAGGNALRAPFAADKVGNGERVFGNVWLLVIATQAAIKERILAATVRRLVGSGPRPRLTASHSLTRVVPGFVCEQIRGQLSTCVLHHTSTTMSDFLAIAHACRSTHSFPQWERFRGQ